MESAIWEIDVIPEEVLPSIVVETVGKDVSVTRDENNNNNGWRWEGEFQDMGSLMTPLLEYLQKDPRLEITFHDVTTGDTPADIPTEWPSNLFAVLFEPEWEWKVEKQPTPAVARPGYYHMVLRGRPCLSRSRVLTRNRRY